MFHRAKRSIIRVIIREQRFKMISRPFFIEISTAGEHRLPVLTSSPGCSLTKSPRVLSARMSLVILVYASVSGETPDSGEAAAPGAEAPVSCILPLALPLSLVPLDVPPPPADSLLDVLTEPAPLPATVLPLPPPLQRPNISIGSQNTGWNILPFGSLAEPGESREHSSRARDL